MRFDDVWPPDAAIGDAESSADADADGEPEQRKAAEHQLPPPRARRPKADQPVKLPAEKRGVRRARTGGVQHIDDLLRPLADRPVPPPEDELNALAKQMADHLLTCVPCQETLSAIIGRLTIQTAEGSAARARGLELLERFNAVLVKARVRKQFDPYAAMLYLQGEAVARERFPDVAAHLDDCETCHAEVEARKRRFAAQMKEAVDQEGN